jgi:hypothetical protein
MAVCVKSASVPVSEALIADVSLYISYFATLSLCRAYSSKSYLLGPMSNRKKRKQENLREQTGALHDAENQVI